ncbi:MAG: electron transport complex subunit RsxC [Wenzhouxiangellaceae bacterium]|nr:electron transport complex subunit RsxC [Wenzhouxiangellaceae bacterium]
MPDIEVGEQLHRFPGGLKLRHHKQIACRDPLMRPALPETLCLPLQQHQGPPGECLVETGEQVLKGQPLTRARSDCEVPIHAPTSGTVSAIEDRPAGKRPGGLKRCIVLTPDGRERWCARKPVDDWHKLDAPALIEHWRAGGLAGLGGAMFPTAAKLRGDWDDQTSGVHTLILNGSECEPYISCDEMLMRIRPEAVVTGGLMLARALGAEQVVIAIEDQMGAVRKAFDEIVDQYDPDRRCRIVQVTTIYPEGGEKQLIQVLTGREVPHDGLPQSLGLVCLNVATAAAARDIIVDGTPVIERIVTISGPGIEHPRNLIALLGTPIHLLIEAAGGLSDEIDRLVLGGPMSGLPLASDQVPIEKGSNCILALRPVDTQRAQPEMPCINCGECVRVCPASLLPQELFHYLRAENYAEAERLNLFDCIECGCCAHVCPSHIPLVDHYRHGKDIMRERGIEDARARRAQQRFEARQARLADEAEQRKARRERRERKLEHPDGAKSEVQAAIERARARAAQNGNDGSDDDGDQS